MAYEIIEYDPNRKQVTTLEYMNPAYSNLQENSLSLAAGGDLGRFELDHYQHLADAIPVSRSLFLTHPDFPSNVFTASVGLVEREGKNGVSLKLPDTARSVTDVIRDFGGLIIRDGKFISKEFIAGETSILGAYTFSELAAKVAYTQYAGALLKDVPNFITPEIVAWGEYPELQLKDDTGGWLVQAKPNNLTSAYVYMRELYKGDPRNHYAETKPLLSALYNRIARMHTKDLIHFQVHNANWAFSNERNNIQIYLGDWTPPMDSVIDETGGIDPIRSYHTDDPKYKSHDIGYALFRNTGPLIASLFAQNSSEQMKIDIAANVVSDCYRSYLNGLGINVGEISRSRIMRDIYHSQDYISMHCSAIDRQNFYRFPNKLLSSAARMTFEDLLRTKLN